MAAIRIVRTGSDAQPLNVLVAGKDILAAALNLRYIAGRLAWMALLVVAAVEALLGVRLWAQLAGQSINEGTVGTVYRLTEPLVAPFRRFETAPIKPTGIFEFATLAAMEVYLIAFLATIGVLIILPWIVRLLLFILKIFYRVSVWLVTPRPLKGESVEPMAQPQRSESLNTVSNN